MDESYAQITLLLRRIAGGDRKAEDELLSLVYGQLHRIAQRQFKSERPGHTLQPTALINELYLRVLYDSDIEWQSRAHFYAVAAETIRRVLIDHARAANAQRRPHPGQRVHLDDVLTYSDDRAYELLMLDEALRKLKELDPRQAQVVDLRYFGGFSVEETARALGVSERTVKRDWAMAHAWLSATLNGTGPTL
jgi:RNA polymerase sigma factor (TIGR02999 family)